MEDKEPEIERAIEQTREAKSAIEEIENIDTEEHRGCPKMVKISIFYTTYSIN